MFITTDPRCPQHPNHQVHARMSQFDAGPCMWICVACHRPLGRAGSSIFNWAPWPQRRIELPRDMAFAKIDWDWVFKHAWRYPE